MKIEIILRSNKLYIRHIYIRKIYFLILKTILKVPHDDQFRTPPLLRRLISYENSAVTELYHLIIKKSTHFFSCQNRLIITAQRKNYAWIRNNSAIDSRILWCSIQDKKYSVLFLSQRLNIDFSFPPRQHKTVRILNVVQQSSQSRRMQHLFQRLNVVWLRKMSSHA